MRITRENAGNERLKSLVEDAETLGLWISQQDYHDEADEYPDYFGMYRLKSESLPESESIGVEMTLDELDMILCALLEYVEIRESS